VEGAAVSGRKPERSAAEARSAGDPPPLLTVITICRNRLDELRATVDSVLSRRPDGVEYWVIDGASTDGTPEYLRQLEPAGVRVLSEPDAGISDAMNKGIHRATGRWVAHLHAGDRYLPGALETVTRRLAETDADILCGWLIKEEPGGDVLCRCDPEGLSYDMSLNHPATFVRREWFERCGGFDLSYRNSMDYELFLRLRQAGARFAEIPEPLARMPGGGQSELSLWATLSENHRARSRHLSGGLTRSRWWLVALYAKGSVRILLQRIGLEPLVRAYRRRFGWPRKT
jgi:glycosyltransferase involved in cell wall biosynthesis